MKQGLIAAAVWLSVLVAGAAHADPLLLTSGTITATPQSGGVTTLVDFRAMGFDLGLPRSALFDLEARSFRCEGTDCPAGTLVAPNAELHPIGFAAGTVNGVTYSDGPAADPRLLVATDLYFTSGNIVLPGSASDRFSAIIPFAMTGHFLGYSTHNGFEDRTLILDTDIAGQGLAQLNFDVVARGGSKFFINPSITYSFEPASPAAVPEPATWILLSSGLMGTLLLVMRRRQLGAPEMRTVSARPCSFGSGNLLLSGTFSTLIASCQKTSALMEKYGIKHLYPGHFNGGHFERSRDSMTR